MTALFTLELILSDVLIRTRHIHARHYDYTDAMMLLMRDDGDIMFVVLRCYAIMLMLRGVMMSRYVVKERFVTRLMLLITQRAITGALRGR